MATEIKREILDKFWKYLQRCERLKIEPLPFLMWLRVTYRHVIKPISNN